MYGATRNRDYSNLVYSKNDVLVNNIYNLYILHILYH